MDIWTLIGIGLTLFFYLIKKKLRIKKYYYLFLLVSFPVALAGLFYRGSIGVIGDGYLKSNSADYLLAPFTYVMLYQFLRFLFIEIYGFEPSFGGGRLSNYDKDEKRELTIGDYVVEYIPLVASLGLPLIISTL